MVVNFMGLEVWVLGNWVVEISLNSATQRDRCETELHIKMHAIVMVNLVATEILAGHASGSGGE